MLGSQYMEIDDKIKRCVVFNIKFCLELRKRIKVKLVRMKHGSYAVPNKNALHRLIC